jgi:hypothetical protein
MAMLILRHCVTMTGLLSRDDATYVVANPLLFVGQQVTSTVRVRSFFTS